MNWSSSLCRCHCQHIVHACRVYFAWIISCIELIFRCYSVWDLSHLVSSAVDVNVRFLHYPYCGLLFIGFNFFFELSVCLFCLRSTPFLSNSTLLASTSLMLYILHACRVYFAWIASYLQLIFHSYYIRHLSHLISSVLLVDVKFLHYSHCFSFYLLFFLSFAKTIQIFCAFASFASCVLSSFLLLVSYDLNLSLLCLAFFCVHASCLWWIFPCMLCSVYIRFSFSLLTTFQSCRPSFSLWFLNSWTFFPFLCYGIFISFHLLLLLLVILP